MVACGDTTSGSGSGASADQSKSDAALSNKYGFGKTTPELQTTIDKIEIQETPQLRAEGSYRDVDSDGITFKFTRYVEPEIGDTYIYVRIDNNSTKTLGDIHCSVRATKDGEGVNIANLNYGPMTVDPGEAGMDKAEFNPYKRSSFEDFDKLSLDGCNRRAFDREIVDVENGPVKVDFVEFGDTRAELTLSITNNKTTTIGYANCVYDAKIGNVIVDMADIDFRGAINKSGNYIEAGETVEKTARFSDSESVDDFDSTFDYKNLNCSYKDIK